MTKQSKKAQATAQDVYFNDLKALTGFGSAEGVTISYLALKDAESTAKTRFIEFICNSVAYCKTATVKCKTIKGARKKIREVLQECEIKCATAQLQKYSLLIEYLIRRAPLFDTIRDFLTLCNTTLAYKIAREDAPNPVTAAQDYLQAQDSDSDSDSASDSDSDSASDSDSDSASDSDSDSDSDSESLWYKADLALKTLEDIAIFNLSTDEKEDIQKRLATLLQAFEKAAKKVA